MTIQQLITKYNGKYVEVAGSPNATNQCVDLANLYIRDVLGLPIIEWTNAIDFPSRAGDKYDYIKNSPTNVPQEGDLVIWDKTPGHIAIFIEGNATSFRSFDQNFPTGSPCHIQNHTYTNVLGWLRVKQQVTPTPPQPVINDQTKIDLGVSIGIMEVQAIRSTISDLRNSLSAEKSANLRLLTTIEELADKIDELSKSPTLANLSTTQLVLELLKRFKLG